MAHKHFSFYGCLIVIPPLTENLLSFEPQNVTVDEFHEVGKRRAADFEALKA